MFHDAFFATLGVLSAVGIVTFGVLLVAAIVGGKGGE